jgi:hypothetical protein
MSNVIFWQEERPRYCGKGKVAIISPVHLKSGIGGAAFQLAEKLCFVSGHDFSRAVND